MHGSHQHRPLSPFSISSIDDYSPPMTTSGEDEDEVNDDEFFRLSIDTFDSSDDERGVGGGHQDLYYDPLLCLSSSNYQILSLLQEGSSGQVYLGKRLNDSHPVALKFFGYQDHHDTITHTSIYHEIQMMSQFSGISGVVQLHGYFLDSEEGLLPHPRLSSVPYPVIVMELLEGGELFQKIYTSKDKVVESEQDLVRLFHRIVFAVQSIHDHHYIHRDLKLENMMFLDHDVNTSPIKIIDLGSMISTSGCDDGVYRDCVEVGTAAYLAPESIQYFDYSAASDVFQLGCCLYSMLSGHSPYGSSTSGGGGVSERSRVRYLPMSGLAWATISPEAKDLVRQMLQKNPQNRITLTSILTHPWLTESGQDLSLSLLSEDYYQRMKFLALRQQMKVFFLDQQVIQNNRDRRKKLKKLIPLIQLSSSLSSSFSHVSLYTSTSDSSKSVVSKRSMSIRQPPPAHLPDDCFVKLSSSPPSSPLIKRPRLRSSFSASHLPSPSNASTSVVDTSSKGRAFQRSSSTDCAADKTNTKSTIAITSTLSQKIIHQLRLQHCNPSHLPPPTPTHSSSSIYHMDSDKFETRLESFRSAMLHSFTTSSTGPPHHHHHHQQQHITYAVFRELLIESELEELATRRVFNIFDLHRTGMVDMKDFLLTMAALNFGKSSSRQNLYTPTHTTSTQHPWSGGSDDTTTATSTMTTTNTIYENDELNESNHSLAQLYFSIFDITGRGFIEIDQMRIAIDYILYSDDEELGPRKGGAADRVSPRKSRDEVFDVEMLFAAIDTDGNGRINFEQFSRFFNHLRSA
jgi:serine/threonine protein kinase